nr:EOG090X03YR [Triops cancriformis]
MSDFGDFDEGITPRGERWAPVGANAQDLEILDKSVSTFDRQESYESHEHDDWWQDFDKFKMLEEEQEQLNYSLMALTSHFGQVQFRLKQIVDAPAEDKERLLKELEEFAFRGIPDVQSTLRSVEGALSPEPTDHEAKMEAHRAKQQELIAQLKNQLEDLERYAYETGDADLPQNVVMERQKIIIDQLKNKLNLDVDELGSLTLEDLRKQVDQAIGQLINPLKVKEQLVVQLKTQVSDLERFIQFLQGETSSQACHCKCKCPVHGTVIKASDAAKMRAKINERDLGSKAPRRTPQSEARQEIMRKISNLLQMIVVAQFGCGSETRPNVKKSTAGFRHWGDLRARLEVTISRVYDLVRAQARRHRHLDSFWLDGSDECSPEIIVAVRKDLCMALKDLMQHGLTLQKTSGSLVPFLGCLPQSASQLALAGSFAKTSSQSYSSRSREHPWQLFLAFYHAKKGEEFNAAPQRSLARSFQLELETDVGSAKKSLLAAIGQIVATHGPYKRSQNSHLKALVCAGLNGRKLVSWFRLIYHSPSLVEENYYEWSYAAKTGFDDTLKSLDRLTPLKFDLPVNLAVHSLRDIKDAF